MDRRVRDSANRTEDSRFSAKRRGRCCSQFPARPRNGSRGGTRPSQADPAGEAICSRVLTRVGGAGWSVSVSTTSKTGGGDGMAITITPDGRWVHVADNASDTVIPINLSTRRAGSPIHAGPYPVALAFGR